MNIRNMNNCGEKKPPSKTNLKNSKK